MKYFSLCLLALLFVLNPSSARADGDFLSWIWRPVARLCAYVLQNESQSGLVSDFDWKSLEYLSSGVYSVANSNGTKWVLRFPMAASETRFEKFAIEFVNRSGVVRIPEVQYLNSADRDLAAAKVKEFFEDKMGIRFYGKEVSFHLRGPVTVRKWVEGAVGEVALRELIPNFDVRLYNLTQKKYLNSKALEKELRKVFGPLAQRLADVWVLQYVLGIHDFHENNWVLTAEARVIPVDLASWSDKMLVFDISEVYKGIDSDPMVFPWPRTYGRMASVGLVDYLESLTEQSIREFADRAKFTDLTDLHVRRMFERIKEVQNWRSTP